MPPEGDQLEKKKLQQTYNLTLAAVTGQVGCLTLIVILAALFGGLWLDNRFDTRPIFTIGLVIASVPVTLFLMIWVVKKATTKLKGDQEKTGN
jgi:MFS-type transporter involved in bile tolerance (Atg22 family)